MPNIMHWPGANIGKGIFEAALAYYGAGGDNTGASTAANWGALATGALAGSGALTPNPKAPTVNIPPPPGAAMIDPSGSQAAASQRARAAAAGGLQSTISPGATSANGAVGPTGGGKSALGQ